ncbi:MAG: hypothetical protein Q9227_000817 [Pyrenula ochraceoflavens]
MAQSSSSSGGLGEFLTDAYSVVSAVKSIITETPSSTSATSTSSSSASSSSISSNTSPKPTSSPTATTPSASPTSAPSSHHHSVNLLAIILGVVLGVVLILLIALLACCLIRRRRHRRRNTISRNVESPDHAEIERWRGGHDHAAANAGWRPNGSGTSYTHISGGDDHRVHSGPPDMSQHPAFRSPYGDENEIPQSTNPFVPAPPPTRRTAPNSRPGLTDGSVPGHEPFINKHPGATAVAAGLGGAALGRAAANRHSKNHETNHGILRKPTPSAQEKAADENLPEAYVSEPGHSSYGHNRIDSRSPLMGDHAADEKHPYHPDDVGNNGSHHEDSLPTHYTSNRPPTPMGLMAFGGSGGDRKPSPHNDPHDSSSTTSRSYDSARSTSSIVAPPAPPAAVPPRNSHSVTPPSQPSRSPKRARFSANVEEWDGGRGSAANGHRSISPAVSPISAPSSSSSPPHQHEENSYSSRMSRNPNRNSAGARMGMGEKRPSQERRLRLSDLREEERRRMMDWGYDGGYGGHGGGVGQAY